jgi:hypothetical protein
MSQKFRILISLKIAQKYLKYNTVITGRVGIELYFNFCQKCKPTFVTIYLNLPEDPAFSTGARPIFKFK